MILVNNVLPKSFSIAGVLFSYSNNRIQSEVFDYNYSIEILVIVVLGGMGSINGSMIAAVLVTLLNRELANILTGNLAVLKDLVYALVLIAIVIYNNAPALKDFRESHNLKDMILRRKKKSSAETQAKEVE